MAILETSHKWSVFTSTGTGDPVNVKMAQSLTIGVETSPACTATIQVLHRMGTSTGPFSVLSTVAPSTGSFTTVQFLGPLDWVTLRVSDKSANSTNTVTGYLLGN